MTRKSIAPLVSLCLTILTSVGFSQSSLTNDLVAWYPLTGSLVNQINQQQVATLLDGAVLNADCVAVNANAVRIPAPFPASTSVFTVSLLVYESGLTDPTGGAYLVAGEAGNNVHLMTHNWVNRWEHPEGSYYGPCLGAESTNDYNAAYFVAPLQAGAIRSHWVHYVFVSNTNAVTLFQNGVKIGSVDIPGFPVWGDWFLGKHWWYTGSLSLVSSESIIGNFKCLKVYSRALSAEEAGSLYVLDSNQPQAVTETITIPQLTSYSNDSHTVLLEHFDGITSGSPNGSVTYSNGVFGQGVHLNLGSWVSWNLGALPEATVEFWGKLETFEFGTYGDAPIANFIQADYAQFYAQTFVTYIQSNMALGDYHCGCNPPGGNWAGMRWPNGAWPTSTTITPNTWHHYATTWGHQGFHFYVDGMLVYTNANTYGQNGATRFWAIGGLAQGGPASYPGFAGMIDELRISDIQRTFVALPSAINVNSPIPDQSGTYGSSFRYTFPANTFSDPGSSHNLSYTVTGVPSLPPGISFDASARIFSGTPTLVGAFNVTVIAADHRNPALVASNTFKILVNPASLTITANSTSKTYGQAVSFGGTEFTASGLVNGDTVTSVALTCLGGAAGATVAGSPYAIVPNGAIGTGLGNYTITYVSGSLVVSAAPLTASINNPVSACVLPVGSSMSFSGSFSPSGVPPYRAEWTFSSESCSFATPGTVNPNNTVSTANAVRFSMAGAHVVTLTVSDGANASACVTMSTYVVVYDPNVGFVTGAGWILSPPGACKLNPALSGKAAFEFTSKYQKGETVPAGNMQFHFQTGEFRFQSTAYQWLMVTGAKAQSKGSGTVNGTGDYTFLVTATDGQANCGGGVDKLRIKIWDTATGAIIYNNVRDPSDNLSDVDPQAIAEGNIVIHQK